MRLYWGPHTCAIGIHILLDEIGEPYEKEKVDTAGGQTRQPAFMAVRPVGSCVSKHFRSNASNGTSCPMISVHQP